MAEHKSPMQKMVTESPTEYWNDSCALEELRYAIQHGATGATTNPGIVVSVLKKEMPVWRERIQTLVRENPTWGEVEVGWQLIDEMTVRGAAELRPIFERTGGRQGRLSTQTNPQNYRNKDKLVEQAMHFDALAPNIQVKIPVTKAGLEAIEEVTYRGVNINATVSFCVPQAMRVAEAVERALRRREAEGLPTAQMTPICTIMVGRLDDWVHVLEKRDSVVLTPGYGDWAGVAALKKAHALYKARGYRTKLLIAAYRNHLHWSEFVGGDVIQSMPCEWAKLFNASDVEVTAARWAAPVDPQIIATLERKFPDFAKAYSEDGLPVDEFDSFGPTARTLRAFIASYHELLGIIRDIMIPDPDKK